jgi:hypothetical protein
MRASEGKGKEMEITLHCVCGVVWRVLVEEELLQSARLIYRLAARTYVQDGIICYRFVILL